MGVPLLQICAGWASQVLGWRRPRPHNLQALVLGSNAERCHKDHDGRQKKWRGDLNPWWRKWDPGHQCCWTPSLWRAARSPWGGGKGDRTRRSLVTRQPEEIKDQGMIRTILLCGCVSPILADPMPVGMVVQLHGGQRAISLSRGMAKSTTDSRKVREQIRKSWDTWLIAMSKDCRTTGMVVRQSPGPVRASTERTWCRAGGGFGLLF